MNINFRPDWAKIKITETKKTSQCDRRTNKQTNERTERHRHRVKHQLCGGGLKRNENRAAWARICMARPYDILILYNNYLPCYFFIYFTI